ncbi:SPOR domain-containing protein [Novosphingobium sp. MMS21-SN21R]|uniref:SPOR domain-containing protein n=1 Tax=Novosphingobium sp. MMS21-SN21R TaxID=2969298 RepID=UPI00288674D1|nr:SPOR domain-containing protein [Novosphingobium sp. MMS21-SN21R]MDT0508753.1 SPOR domain-containing protein [Novosphingobium sp. MMS21-SN21R]
MTIRFTFAHGPVANGLKFSLGLLLAAAAPCAYAQADDDPDGPATVSRPVVQSVAPSPSRELNAALARLAADPRNVVALYDAASAALRLGDSDAAIGFLSRANDIQPGDPRSKVLIGKAYLLAENPVDAVRAFDEAERAGGDTYAMASDRALAYDLVGDNGRAQRWYQVALSRGSDDELTRRYALSLAIAGDRRGAEVLLAPLIAKQDRATWRTRTFVMAVTGGPDEAVAVAYASMPQDLAAGIAPYLRYMPRLTPAQQAAAANFGRFPRAADIGRDDPRVAQYAALNPRATRFADAGLIPAGAPLGASTEKPSREKRRRPGKDERTPAPTGRVQALGTTPLTPPQQLPQSAPVPRPGFTDTAIASAAPAVRPSVAPVTTPPAPAKPKVLSVLDLPPGAARPYVAPVRQPAPATAPAPQPAPPVPVAAAPVRTATAELPPVPATAAAPQPVVVAPVPTPVAKPAPSVGGFDLAKVGGSTAAPVPAAPSATQALAAAPVIAVPVAPSAASSAPVVPPVQTAAASAPAPASTEPPPRPVDLATLFKSFAPPEEERAPAVAAVDITRLPAKAVPKVVKADPRGERPDGPTDVSRTSAKEAEKGTVKDAKTAKDAKAAKAAQDAKDAKAKKAAPSHPSRIWVQVLTGANKDMMDNEWRRLVKEAPDALRSRKPYVSPWRSNFRLLTGPFESEAAAQEFITKLRKGGVSSYQWTSPAGQAVDTLPLK